MTQSSYDEMPYATFAQRAADPNRLAALGRLYGVEVPSPERASIHEIGCGTGVNLIHIAERFPESRCVGVDISERHILEGQKLAIDSGVKNVELRCGDIQQAAVGNGEFDFVICHGVYSWVSPHIQHQLLSVISSSLSDGGVAYVSYNVLPGWRQRGAIRDIMITGAQRQSALTGSYEPTDRLSGAMELLSLVGSVRSRDGDLYGSYIKESLERFKDSHPSYLFHEYLEEYNSAVLFSDFMRLAELHGLQFVSEAKPSLMSTDDLGSDVREYLSKLEGDIITQEQCLDVIRNRMFRETILCKGHHVLKRDLKASVFKSIHFVTDYRFVKESGRESVFREVVEGREVSTPKDEHSALLKLIGEAGYGGVAFSTLAARGAQVSPHLRDERALMHAIVRLWRAGFVDVTLHRAPISNNPRGVGKVSRLARQQAIRGEGPIVALQHRSCALSPIERKLITLCDGERDLDDIVSASEVSDSEKEARSALSRLIELGFFAE